MTFFKTDFLTVLLRLEQYKRKRNTCKIIEFKETIVMPRTPKPFCQRTVGMLNVGVDEENVVAVIAASVQTGRCL